MKNRIMKGAAVVLTAAFLLGTNVEASTIIVDAKTGEKYENLDEALEHNVVSEDDIEVSIPATKSESDTDYNKADHKDIDVTIQSDLENEREEKRLIEKEKKSKKALSANKRIPIVVLVLLPIACVLLIVVFVLNRLQKRRK